MTAATSTSDWIVAEGWREGLFAKCVSDFAPLPLPFDIPAEPGCSKARAVSKWSKIISRPQSKLFFFIAGYIRGSAALVVIGLLFDFFGTLLTGLGLRSTDPNKKYKYYRVAIYALVVACKSPKIIHPYRREIFHPNQWKNISTINTFSVAALLLAAIILPVQFSKDLANGKSEFYYLFKIDNLDYHVKSWMFGYDIGVHSTNSYHGNLKYRLNLYITSMHSMTNIS